MSRARKLAGLLGGFCIFFGLCGFVVTCSFLLFFHYTGVTMQQIAPAARATFFNLLFISALFTGIDAFRRHMTVEKPVRCIQDALARITAGDFSVRLEPETGGSFSAIMQSIDRMTAELSGVETLRSDFIANVSHEMKTPLAAIQNYGTLLAAPGLAEAERQDYARAVTAAARRLSDLVTNILRLNRLENQQIYPQAAPCDLAEQLRQCILDFEPVWEEKTIEVDAEDIAEDVVVRADGELLALVWSNLLSNAFKFTPAGGRVSVSLKKAGGCALVTVADTGIGMSPAVGAHIFEKFYQGDTSRAGQGNGLGLALVKRIMDITGGTVTVQSAPGKGSAFTVQLPVE